MTLFDDLSALRRAVESSGPTGTGVPDQTVGLTPVDVTTGPGGQIDLVTAEVTEALTINAAEAVLGPARHLPRAGPGRPSMILFPDTIPDEGSVGATVLAEVDGDRIVRVLVRRDEFPPETGG